MVQGHDIKRQEEALVVTHRNNTSKPPIKVLKWLCRLYSVSGSNSILPKTFQNTSVTDQSREPWVVWREWDQSYLHPDDCVDEEEHCDEKNDVRQRLQIWNMKTSLRIPEVNLETLDEGPEEDPDGVSLSQQLDQSSCSEQAEEANIEKVFLKRENLFLSRIWRENRAFKAKALRLSTFYHFGGHQFLRKLNIKPRNISINWLAFGNSPQIPPSERRQYCQEQWWSQKCSTNLWNSSKKVIMNKWLKLRQKLGGREKCTTWQRVTSNFKKWNILL